MDNRSARRRLSSNDLAMGLLLVGGGCILLLLSILQSRGFQLASEICGNCGLIILGVNALLSSRQMGLARHLRFIGALACLVGVVGIGFEAIRHLL